MRSSDAVDHQHALETHRRKIDSTGEVFAEKLTLKLEIGLVGTLNYMVKS